LTPAIPWGRIAQLRAPIARTVLLVALVATAPARSGDEPAAASALEAELVGRLRATIEAEIARLDGVAGVYVEDLASGLTIEHAAETSFAQASAIKVPILWELFAQADEGRIDLDRRARRPAATGMGGILENLSPDVELSPRDLAVLMIVHSDNGATNALIDRLGMERVSARMASLGLPRTLLRRRMLDSEAARAGRENVSTPREMAALAKRIHGGRGLSQESVAEVRRILGVWSTDPFRSGIGEDSGAAVFEKPGELPGVRTSVALVELPRRAYVVAISTAALADEVAGEAFVTRLSREIFSVFSRLARSNEAGRFVD
jgi:beta-lactamase class A